MVSILARSRQVPSSALLGAALLCLLALIAPSSGEAKIGCHHNGGQMSLAVTISGFDEADITRFGDEILVSSYGSPIRCRGEAATVTNTDRVDVLVKNGAAAWIALSGGPFAPGATPEPDASSEIEFTIDGNGFVNFEGGRGRDHFRFMDSGSESGVNLNADQDEDLDLVSLAKRSLSLLFVVDGGPGADLIDAPARLRGIEAFAVGGKGDDTLVSPSSESAILEGGGGRDRLIGGAGGDLLDPGRGVDTVKARGGPDGVMISPDRRRDRIYCGAGADRVGKPDDRDRLVSCERVMN